MWADETLLGEVVRNLIENAMRYSAADSSIEVSATLAEGGVEVAISDHGEGVPAEEQDRIFQPFHRASSEEGSVKGSGLGTLFRRSTGAGDGWLDQGREPHLAE